MQQGRRYAREGDERYACEPERRHDAAANAWKHGEAGAHCPYAERRPRCAVILDVPGIRMSRSICAACQDVHLLNAIDALQLICVSVALEIHHNMLIVARF